MSLQQQVMFHAANPSPSLEIALEIAQGVHGPSTNGRPDVRGGVETAYCVYQHSSTHAPVVSRIPGGEYAIAQWLRAAEPPVKKLPEMAGCGVLAVRQEQHESPPGL